MLIAVDSTTVATSLAIAVVAPSLLLFLTGRQTRRNKQQDWDRQDEVAARLAESTAAAVTAAKTAAETAAQVAAAAAATSAQMAEQLSVIHGLVNSSLTEAWDREFSAEKSALDALQRMIALSEQLGVPVRDSDRATANVKEARIVEIAAILASRQRQQAVIDDQIARSADRAKETAAVPEDGQ